MKHHQTAHNKPREVAAKTKPVDSVKKQHGAKNSQPTALSEGHEEMVRQTAYFLYESRSREDGHELEDWLQAEAQLARNMH